MFSVILELSAADIANEEWSTQTRYLGCGAMVVGGIWALIKLRSVIIYFNDNDLQNLFV